MVAYECMKLTPGQRMLFYQEAFSQPKSLGTIRKFMLILDYDRPTDHDYERVLSVATLNFEDATAVSRLVKKAPSLIMTEAWSGAWRRTALIPSPSLRLIIPVLVILPRNVRDPRNPQVMTAFCTLHNNPLSKDSSDSNVPEFLPHLRWVHWT